MNKPTRFYSNKQEKKVAKTLGGKKVANSGATAFHKGDVIFVPSEFVKTLWHGFDMFN